MHNTYQVTLVKIAVKVSKDWMDLNGSVHVSIFTGQLEPEKNGGFSMFKCDLKSCELLAGMICRYLEMAIHSWVNLGVLGALKTGVFVSCTLLFLLDVF